MRKSVLLGLGLSICLSFTAYAGEWQQDANGWRWQNDDGTSPLNGWQWLDGNQDGISECYYFDSDGYMLADTTTPDNYQVNKDGAWVVNGEIQRQSVSSEVTNESDVFVDLLPWFTTDLQYFDSAVKLTPKEEGWYHYDWRRIGLMEELSIERTMEDGTRGFRVMYDFDSPDGHIEAIYAYPRELIKGLKKYNTWEEEVKEIERLAKAGGAEVEIKYSTVRDYETVLIGGGFYTDKSKWRDLKRADLTIKYNGLLYKYWVGGVSWSPIMKVTKE